MEQLTNRRGRRYDLAPLAGIDDPGVAYAAAILDEARERCIDLIADMTDDVMWRRPAGSPFSAGDLVLHMNWAEYLWLSKVGPHLLEEPTVATLERGDLKRLYAADALTMPISELVALCRTTRDQVMIPGLAKVGELDESIGSSLPDGSGPKTVRQILMHVTASWVYHSGQVGIMTMQNGIDYQWAFA